MLNQNVCWVEIYLVYVQSIYMILFVYLFTGYANGLFDYVLLHHCDNDFEINGL